MKKNNGLKIFDTRSVRKYKAGYVVKDELTGYDKEHAFYIKRAYNRCGAFIGEPKIARYLLVKSKIEPYLIPGGRICQIGFCKEDQKWYGWSHRAMAGFGIGDRIFEERYGNNHTPFIKHGRKVIKTLKDAKLAAIRFAKHVS